MQQKEIGSFEAKTHFAQLLTQVIEGNDVVITRHGKRVAVLSAYKAPEAASSVEEAMRTLRRLRKGLKLNSSDATEKLTIKDLINEGRKY